LAGGPEAGVIIKLFERSMGCAARVAVSLFKLVESDLPPSRIYRLMGAGTLCVRRWSLVDCENPERDRESIEESCGIVARKEACSDAIFGSEAEFCAKLRFSPTSLLFLDVVVLALRGKSLRD
jgi:hypothetical protein